MLDLIYSNDATPIEDIEINSPIGKSDHTCVEFTCNLRAHLRNNNKVVYMYERADWAGMKEKLSIDWVEYLGSESVETMWRKFRNKFREVIEECVPNRVFEERQNTGKGYNRRNLPLNRKLRKMIKRKQRLWESAEEN